MISRPCHALYPGGGQPPAGLLADSQTQCLVMQINGQFSIFFGAQFQVGHLKVYVPRVHFTM
jgi:hypothetical protein